MSPTTTPPSNFQSIFDAALADYAKKTGIDLAAHPLARKLENCHSVSDILDLLQGRANQFHTYRNGNRKLITCLKPVVHVLHSVSGVLAEVASLVSPQTNSPQLVPFFTFRQVPFQPSKAILVGIDVLLAVCILRFLHRLYGLIISASGRYRSQHKL